MTVTQSMYADELRQRGFTKAVRVAHPVEDGEHEHHECAGENAEFMALHGSKKPYFRYLGEGQLHTLVFDEVREVWMAHGQIDLTDLGFVLYDPDSKHGGTQWGAH